MSSPVLSVLYVSWPVVVQVAELAPGAQAVVGYFVVRRVMVQVGNGKYHFRELHPILGHHIGQMAFRH